MTWQCQEKKNKNPLHIITSLLYYPSTNTYLPYIDNTRDKFKTILVTNELTEVVQ